MKIVIGLQRVMHNGPRALALLLLTMVVGTNVDLFNPEMASLTSFDVQLVPFGS